MSAFDYTESIVTVRRKGDISDPYIPFSINITINNGKVQLPEIPDKVTKVLVTGNSQTWFEVSNKRPGNTEYKVSYLHGYVEFDPSNDGKTLKFEFMGTGNTFLSSERVWTESDGTSVTETLKDVVDAAKTAIDNVGDVEQVIQDAETATMNANDAASNANTAAANANQVSEDFIAAEAGRVTAEDARVVAENVRISNEDDRIAAETVRQTNETARENAEDDRIAAEIVRASAEDIRVSNEDDRVSAESSRVTAENARETAETDRAIAESTRVTNESDREDAEITRESNEAARISNENARISAESGRVTVENDRATAESTRVASESDREDAENLRESAETARVSAESARVSAESLRETAEGNRESAEGIRKSNEDDRIAAESTRDSSEDTRVTNESARQTSESGRVSAESDRVTVETNRVNAEADREDAETIRSTNESIRISNESGREDAETTRESNESSRQAQELDRQTNTANAIDEINETNDAFSVCEAYDNSTTYKRLNKATYNGRMYICIQDSTGHLPTDITYWLLAADKGVDGTGSGTVTEVKSSSGDLVVSDGSVNPDLSISSTLKNAWNGKQDALGFAPEDAANKGVAGGYAGLDESGKVPSSQLPPSEDVSWENLAGKPTSTVVDIDETVLQRHVHANKAALDSITTSKINEWDAKQGALGFIPEDVANKGVAEGYAGLDASAKIPTSQLPDSILGQVEYQSTWNASTNTPELPDASTVKGHYYVTETAGTNNGIDFKIGDWVISNGVEWQKVDNTDAVPTVFGRTGNIVAASGDYSKSDVGLGNVQNYDIASQSEAEAGTVADKYMTPQRVAQAIAAQASAPVATNIPLSPVSGMSATNVQEGVAEAFQAGVTTTERNAWDAKETPTGAQAKADQAEQNAKDYTDTELTDKVDKVAGKGLSTEDYTTVEKIKLAGIAAGAQVNTVTSVAGKTGVVALAKADVGLGSVDNVKQMPIAGGTFTGPAVAQNNTAYTTKQLRNVIISTASPSGGANGDIWFKYS